MRYALAVLEGYSFRSIGKQYTIGECVGVVRMGLYDAGVETIVVSPLALKKFTTGTAKSNKAAVTLGIYKRWGIELTQEDEADAAGLAMVAAYDSKAISGMTAYQLDAMKKTERLF
jgi:Holliday junction resolvasome RuvABC endonuclease subunit